MAAGTTAVLAAALLVGPAATNPTGAALVAVDAAAPPRVARTLSTAESGRPGAADSAGAAARGQVLAVAEPLDPAAPIPDKAAVASLAAAHLAAAQVGPASVSVRDLLTGQDLFAADPSRALAPASTLKILTAIAALATIGPDAKLTTAAVLTRTGAATGTVTLVAGGDTTLGPDAASPGQVMGRAGLGDLAWQAAVELRRLGVEAVEVRLDDTVFSGPAVYPDWEWSLGSTWGAPATPLAVMGGRAGAAFDAVTYLADPALGAAQQFASRLAAAGRDTSVALPLLAVTGAVARAAAPARSEPLAVVESAPIRELAAHLLRQSDNTLAESLGRMTAVAMGEPGSFEGCAAAVKRALADLGAPTEGLAIDDCSGLSHGSAVSAATLTSALALAAGPDAGKLGAAVRSLPVAALQGTLINRFNQTGAAGNLRAKTGTLTGVTSLAGLVQTAGGRELVFAVIANPDQTIWTDSARQSIDRFVAALADLA
ncbi:MAG: D-alanyl-D-alanine carboxypeptidase/D-alanyl-D-alanine-endopeptidase [Bifidobacteriaceae bacterium]|nr:D-alanyl-D-alanine carboxypeptidase/D-alanyl-D-alanine-endopeptidase [Bifidobacteriaceae bacterium]